MNISRNGFVPIGAVVHLVLIETLRRMVRTADERADEAAAERARASLSDAELLRYG